MLSIRSGRTNHLLAMSQNLPGLCSPTTSLFQLFHLLMAGTRGAYLCLLVNEVSGSTLQGGVM